MGGGAILEVNKQFALFLTNQLWKGGISSLPYISSLGGGDTICALVKTGLPDCSGRKFAPLAFSLACAMWAEGGTPLVVWIGI